MADYIKKNIISQAYIHIEPTRLDTEEELEKFKAHIEEFITSRVSFFLSPNLPIEVEFEEGSLKSRITILGTVGLLLQGISNYKDFKEGIQLLASDAKRLTDYIISEATFEAGSRQENIIRLEARVGIIGSIQKVINQLESIKSAVNSGQDIDWVITKLDVTSRELLKLKDNINDLEDLELVIKGLREIAGTIPSKPAPPREGSHDVNSLRIFTRKRKYLIQELLSLPK